MAWDSPFLTSIRVILCCWSEGPSLCSKILDHSTWPELLFPELSQCHFNLGPHSWAHHACFASFFLHYLPSLVVLKIRPWTSSITMTQKLVWNPDSQNLHPRPNKSEILGIGAAICILISKWCWPRPDVKGSFFLPFSFVWPTTLNQWFHLISLWNHLTNLYNMPIPLPWISRRRSSYENIHMKAPQVILRYNWGWESLFWITSGWSLIWNLFL